MITLYLIRTIVAITPVIAFLIALTFLDSYKLVKFRSILITLFIGIIAALICLFVNSGLMEFLQWEGSSYPRYISPFIEEMMKAFFIIYLIQSRKVGFMVDAAICGFTVGAGFAVTENIYNLAVLSDTNLFLWIIRGFGTAVMHGGTTAIFGFVSKSLSERFKSKIIRVFLPGFILAVAFHSFFNHFLLTPVISAIILVIGLPLLMILVYHRSEKGLQNWLGIGFDTDTELLTIITTGNITHTRIGEYLLSLKDKFPGEVVADMLCLLRIHLELSIKAKGILLMREAGFKVPQDPEVKKKFEELTYLEKSVGKTGRLAILPFLRWSHHDLWQLYMLGKK